MKVVNPNISKSRGYVAKPKHNYMKYVRIDDNLKEKFSYINQDIFEVGDYLFVPEELFKKTIL